MSGLADDATYETISEGPDPTGIYLIAPEPDADEDPEFDPYDES